MKSSVHLIVCLFSLLRTVLADHHVLVADTTAIISLFAPERIIMFENLQMCVDVSWQTEKK